MAPRRGGGGGGGSSSGIGDTIWGQTVLLPGSHFHNPYSTTQIVFEGISLVGIVAIMIWAAKFKKPHPPFRKMFRWYAFWLSAVMLFANFAIHFSVDIIYEAETLVQQVFFLVTVIIYQSAYISEIALLGVLYLLLPHCSGHPDRESKPRLWKSLQTGHTIFLAILSSIWAAALALKIKYQVDFVTSYYVYDYDSTVKPFVRLDTSYSILYFFATLEVVTWAVVGFVNREKRSEHGQVLTILLAAICFPLFIRSVYLMADVIYEELQQHTGSRQLSLATNIIYILTSLPIYAAIVAICRALVKKHAAVPPYHQDPDHMHYNPNHWANGGNNNGAMTHDPSKPHMAAHEALPPPMYSQQPQPMMQQQQQQGQGHYPPQLQMHPQMAAVYQQPMQQQQQHHHPNQNQTQQPLYNQQQHHPYQNPAYSPYHHQQQQQQATMIPQQQQQRVQSPPLQYEMGGGEVGELPSPSGHGSAR